jgi:hypothetical protein
MKIDNRFVFPLKVLKDYIKSNWKNTNTQYEMLVALSVSKAFEDEKPGDYFIYFPLRASHEKRFPVDKEVFFTEDFFKLFHDGNSPEDIYLLRIEEGHYAVIPLQIKRYGIGKWISKSLENFTDFLQEKSLFATNDMQLIIPLENIPATPEVLKALENASQWLQDNPFPFKGVIAIQPLETGEMLFIQLKPNKDRLLVKKFSREQINDKN